MITAMFVAVMIHSVSGVDPAAEQRALFARQDAERLAALPCQDRFEVVFVRKCQDSIVADPALRFFGSYAQSYCTGASEALVLEYGLCETADGGALECPIQKAEERGTLMGQQLATRLKSRL